MARRTFGDQIWFHRLKFVHRIELAERRLRYCLATRFKLPVRYGDAFTLPAHAVPGALGQFPKPIPKVVWIFWAQGFDRAPDIVKASLASWHKQNPDWEIRELDLSTVGEYAMLPDYANPSGMSLATFADILRIHLLELHGGVWVDATVFCSKPLQHWLPPLMQSGFFAFTNPARGRPIASWFIAAEPNNPIVVTWRALLDRYWSMTHIAHEYFWLHRLFKRAITYSRETRCLWSAMPRVDASGPHTIQRILPFDTIPVELQSALAFDVIAVHKLTWRIPAEQEQKYATFLRLINC